MADENTERRRTIILWKIVRQWNKEKADNRAVYVAICSGCIGSRMTKFLFFLWRENIYACSNINIMYALDSTRQKFDVWIGVAFLSDNATGPVERAADMRQPIQTSISVEFNSLNWIRHGRNATYERGLRLGIRIILNTQKSTSLVEINILLDCFCTLLSLFCTRTSLHLSPVHTTREKFENESIIAFVFEEISEREIKL